MVMTPRYDGGEPGVMGTDPPVSKTASEVVGAAAPVSEVPVSEGEVLSVSEVGLSSVGVPMLTAPAARGMVVNLEKRARVLLNAIAADVLERDVSTPARLVDLAEDCDAVARALSALMLDYLTIARMRAPFVAQAKTTRQ